MSRVSAFGEGQCESVRLLKRKLRVVIPGFQAHRCNNVFHTARSTNIAAGIRGQMTSSRRDLSNCSALRW
jgi:hypothetical protein